MTVILNDNDLFVLSKITNSTNQIDVDYPIININGIDFLKNNDAVDGQSICLVKSISERLLLESLSNLNIENNNLIEGMDQVRHYLFDDSSSNEFVQTG